MAGGRLDSRATGRMLAAGLAFVLVFLTTFAVWAAFTTNGASRNAMHMGQLSNAYSGLLESARMEKAAERRYERDPSPALRAEFVRSTRALTDALHVPADVGSAEDHDISLAVGSRHLEYLSTVGDIFRAIRQGEHGPALRSLDHLADGMFAQLENQLRAAAQARNDQAEQSLQSLRRTELLVLIGTPIAFAAGLVLLGIFSALLLRVMRQAKESQKREVTRLQDAAQRLQALDDMKNAFLQAVSHELRTPLTSILGFALTLQRADEGALRLSSEERAEVVERLAANARRLQELLSELLDLDRMARGILHPHRQPVDVGILVRDIVDLAEVGGRRVRVETQPVVVAVDGPKVERVVENLLNNALKYTPSTTSIFVHVEPFEQGVLIAVDDDGPGVPDQLKEEIFQPFQQGPNRSSHSPGTGIGLSLVARFTELHGGRAWVEDRPGGGASFRVYLPDAPAAEVEGPEDELSALAHAPLSQPGNGEPALTGAGGGVEESVGGKLPAEQSSPT